MKFQMRDRSFPERLFLYFENTFENIKYVFTDLFYFPRKTVINMDAYLQQLDEDFLKEEDEEFRRLEKLECAPKVAKKKTSKRKKKNAA